MHGVLNYTTRRKIFAIYTTGATTQPTFDRKMFDGCHGVMKLFLFLTHCCCYNKRRRRRRRVFIITPTENDDTVHKTRKKERKKLGKMPKPWRYNSFSFFFFSSNDIPYIIQAIYTFIIHVIQYGRLLVYSATTTLHIFRLVVAIVWQPGLSTHFLPQRYLSYVSKFVVVSVLLLTTNTAQSVVLSSSYPHTSHSRIKKREKKKKQTKGINRVTYCTQSKNNNKEIRDKKQEEEVTNMCMCCVRLITRATTSPINDGMEQNGWKK